jgi:hypothetical protein
MGCWLQLDKSDKLKLVVRVFSFTQLGAKMSDDSGEWAKYDFLIKRYSAFRSYIEHEDRLKGERLNRTLIVHGFLLASYGFLVQARVSSAKCLGAVKDCPADSIPYMQVILVITAVMLPVIALMGVFTTFAASQGMRAAKEAIVLVRDKWKNFDIGELHEPGLGLPELTGGGGNRSDGTRRFLRYLLFLWLIIFAVSVYGAIGHLPPVHDAVDKISVKVLR